MRRNAYCGKVIICLWLCCIAAMRPCHGNAKDALISILSSELQRENAAWSQTEYPPYYVSFRVEETSYELIQTSFGVLATRISDQSRIFTPMIRLGSWKLDNFHELQGSDVPSTSAYLPIENDPQAIQQAIWIHTDIAYQDAILRLEAVKSNQAVKAKDEDPSDDYVPSPAVSYYESPFSPADLKFDAEKWEKKLCSYSALCCAVPEMYIGQASLSVQHVRKYFVSSEGSSIVHNLSYVNLGIQISSKADDGMELPLYAQWFAYDIDGLPDDKTVMSAIENLIEKSKKLLSAPVAEPYSGPALLSAEASAVFFHEIFGHRVEGQRMKSEADGQTFKKMIGSQILPSDFSIWMDPTRKKWENQDLNGYYLYDDEGIRSEKVSLVKDGILESFLMSRTPIENFKASNGHGRADAESQPVTRQSNLFVTTSSPLSDKDLRQKLIDEVVAQGKPYGYYFATVTGGFTQTGRYSPNSFNVTPLEVYRIYADGRPDEWVRGVDLVGTPLSMFAQIEAAGNQSAVFTGMCGAESGSIHVSCTSPTLFVKQIETQKKAKSQTLPPILPHP